VLEIHEKEGLKIKDISVIEKIIYSSPSYLKQKKLSKKDIKNAIILNKWGNIFFVKNENELIGFFSIHKRDYGLFLHKLYISKEHQNKGFGKEIIEYLKKNSSEIRLRVHINNTAISFYEKMNFKNTKNSNDFYTMIWKKD
jgi:RimJ/RimL family protein N-acetyltransferase